MIFYFIIFNVFVLMVSSSTNDQPKFFTTSLHFQLYYPTFVFDNIYLGILQYFKVVDNYFSNKNIPTIKAVTLLQENVFIQ